MHASRLLRVLLMLMLILTAGRGALAQAQTTGTLTFLPMPRSLTRMAGTQRLMPERLIYSSGGSPEAQLRAAHLAQKALATAGARWATTTLRGDNSATVGLIMHVDPAQVPRLEAYSLAITSDQIRLVAHDDAGMFHAVMTLRQLTRQWPHAGALPCLRIEDWPDFANRGVMLDISRDKVPTMETLRALVDQFAEWKFNQIQLYTEHTFAYRNHKDVWEKASPMTAAEVKELDAYCRERFIELVPNQNSFGHLDRWLQIPRYKVLAEVPAAASTLSPAEPGSIQLLSELYGELLPNFSSHQINVGCDEVSQLGEGKSKKLVAARGEGQVYLDFLKQIHKVVASHGCTMQFWGDIISNHPELMTQLPEGVIAMEWGYEADSPFAENGKKYAAAGVPYYVCPGSSSWNSLIGRTKNALGNLRNAAQNGQANGAIGYLICDWGDGGHYQYQPYSFLGFGYGAAVSWAGQANHNLDIARALDLHCFADGAGVMGQVMADLGNAYLKTGIELPNATVLNFLLQDHALKFSQDPWSRITAAKLKETESSIRQTVGRMEKTRMERKDAELIQGEVRNNAAMAILACDLGLAQLENNGVEVGRLPEPARAKLIAEIEPIIKEHRRLWLARNRIGGLEESCGGLEHLLWLLQQKG